MAYDIKKIGGKVVKDESLIGEGVSSFQVGENSTAMGDNSVTLGINTFSGLKAYYIKSVDIENKKIYLTDTRITPTVSTDDNTDANFETPNYEVGDEFDLICKNLSSQRMHYHFIAAIVSINNNVVTYDVELPFTEFYEDSAEYSQTFFVSSKPNVGIISIDGSSVAEGESTIAAGKWAHAEGYGSIAAGRFSHAEGRETKAAYAAHSEGYQTIAQGQNSHSEGNKTLAGGPHAHAEGSYSEALGDISHAEGATSKAIGNYSHAEGNHTQAIGQNSHSEGYLTEAQNSGDHAEGYTSIASGGYSHAEGYDTQTAGAGAHSEGYTTFALNEGTHAEGRSTRAEGKYSHAEGYGSSALNEGAHAEGRGTKAEGKHSHAEGYNTKALATNSHSEGGATTASGGFSHAEGNSTIASGDTSHAEGSKAVASGVVTHSEGWGTIAAGKYQHVQGKWNDADTNNKYAHIVGNGTGENIVDENGNITTKNRSNAHTMDWNGNAWFAGDVTVGGLNEKLQTESDVEAKIASLVDSSPETLNTLNEIAQALGDDPNFAGTILEELGKKQNTLTFDETPTEGSSNPVTSGGLFEALFSKIDCVEIDGSEIDDIEEGFYKYNHTTIEGSEGTTADTRDPSYTYVFAWRDGSLAEPLCVQIKIGRGIWIRLKQVKSETVVTPDPGESELPENSWEWSLNSTPNEWTEWRMFLDTSDIVDDLITESAAHPLSANMGKFLDDIKANKEDLADVATSGSYEDLTDTPISTYKVDEEGTLYISEVPSEDLKGNSIFIRYSEYADGTDFTSTWSKRQCYLGVYVGQSAPTDKESYEWVMFREDSKPVTTIPAILETNTSYNFGEVTELSLSFPIDAIDGDTIYITFTSGVTATNLIVDATNTSDFELIPESNCGYEICGKFNGTLWILSDFEYTYTAG